MSQYNTVVSSNHVTSINPIMPPFIPLPVYAANVPYEEVISTNHVVINLITEAYIPA